MLLIPFPFAGSHGGDVVADQRFHLGAGEKRFVMRLGRVVGSRGGRSFHRGRLTARRRLAHGPIAVILPGEPSRPDGRFGPILLLAVLHSFHRRGFGLLRRLIGDRAAEPMACLVDELKKTISYLRRQGSTLMPDRILLFGGGAAVKNSASFLSSRIDIPVSRWQPAWPADDNDHAGSARNVLFGPAMALSALAFRERSAVSF